MISRIQAVIKRFNARYASGRKRRAVRGFTLVEVMVATCVLALGFVFVYEAFFTSLDLSNYYEDYLNIAPWLNQKIQEVENYLSHTAAPGAIQTGGLLVKGKRQFIWDLSYSLLDEVKLDEVMLDGAKKEHKLYRIDCSVSWRAGKRSFTLSRNTCALYETR